MNENQRNIVKKILNRMISRRGKEQKAMRFLTLSYAVSTKTGSCYVGYNNRKFPFGEDKDKRWGSATGKGSTVAIYSFDYVCAEASALSIALSYDEQIDNLVFFAMDKDKKPFTPCDKCIKWIKDKPKGVLYFDYNAWKIYNEDKFSTEDWNWLEKAANGYSTNDISDYKGTMNFF